MINFLCLKLTLSAAAMVKESNPARMEVGYNPPPTKKDCRFNQKKKKGKNQWTLCLILIN